MLESLPIMRMRSIFVLSGVGFIDINLLYFPSVPVMTRVKLSRTSRSPTELLLDVKSTMKNDRRQAHENIGFIFNPFTSHQIIC